MGGSNSTNVSPGGGRKKVVIIGSSHAGFLCAQRLIQADPNNALFDIVMVDRADHYENLMNVF